MSKIFDESFLILLRLRFFELLHISSCITQRWFKMNITERDRKMAKFCRSACPVCKHARKKQSGLAYKFVKNAEDGLCPFCKAYEHVHGKKSHEPTWVNIGFYIGSISSDTSWNMQVCGQEVKCVYELISIHDPEKKPPSNFSCLIV